MTHTKYMTRSRLGVGLLALGVAMTMASVPARALAEDLEGDAPSAILQTVEENQDSAIAEGERVTGEVPAGLETPVVGLPAAAEDEGAEEAIASEVEVAADDAVASDEPLELEAADAEVPAATAADGTYTIGTGVATTQVMDVKGGSKKAGANVQTYTSNKTAAQHWNVTYDSETGYYQIANVGSGLALAAASETPARGTNVQIAALGDSLAQRWLLVGDDLKGYEVVSALNDTLCLDVAGGKNKNGTNLQLYTRNGTKAQRFWLYMVGGIAPAEEAVLEDGCYTVKTSTVALDVKSGSVKSGANVQVYTPNGTPAQKWYLSYANGFYTISNVASGLALDVKGGAEVPGANVQLYTSNKTNAQLWRIDKADGGYRIVNKANGLVLDLAGGKVAKGTNIQVYRANGTAAQSFTFTKTAMVNEGYVNIVSALSDSLVFDVAGGSSSDGATVQLYASNGTQAQKWQIKATGDETYEIRSINSAKYLGVKSGKLVQSATKTTWTAVMTPYGVSFQADGMAMDVPGGKAASKKALQVYKPNNTKAQALRFKTTPVLANGTYNIVSALGTVLDVSGGSFSSGANIQAYKSNGSAAQAFNVVRNSDGTYTIANALTELALDVKGGSTADGANVQQYKSNGTAAQKWKVTWENGVFTFTNVKSGKVLEVAGDSAASGANVQQNKATGGKGQQWTVKTASVVLLSKDATLNSYVKKLIASKGWKGESGLKAAYKHIATYGYDLYGKNYVSGDWQSWSVPIAKAMYEQHQGNCYGFAALYTWVARGLGYNAKAVYGKVLTGHGWSPHGWTEISKGGKTYVVDVQQYQNDQAHGRNHNFFMVTYDNAPVFYHVGYDI